MSTEQVLSIEKVEFKGHRYEVWSLNRPKSLNALNSQVLSAILQESQRLRVQLTKDLMSCRALVIRGLGGKAFAAGADISQMNGFSGAEGEAYGRLGQDAFTSLELLPIPTIACIHGFALGGGMELAMGCDVVAATPSSQVGQPECYLGLLPGFGATARFVLRLGLAKALEFLYSGQRMKADEALRLGLIQRSLKEPTSIEVADQEIREQGLEIAFELTHKSAPLALAAIKEVAHSASRKSVMEVQDFEAQCFHKLFETQDAVEGIKAFLEKRPAKFVGK